MSVELLNCDCMDFMADQPDDSFDLAIVDPPYGIGADKPSDKSKMVLQKNGNKLYQKDGNYEHKEWDSKPADKKYFDELKRVSKNQIIFGVNYFDYYLGAGRLVWDKLNDHSDQSDCEVAYCSYNNRVDIVRYMWAGFMQGEMADKSVKKANVQRGNKRLNETRIHPTQKPISLYNWIIRNYADTSDRILDTHLGSGSSAIAAHYLQCRDFVGMEIDDDYYKAACKRFKAETVQEMLF